MSQKILPKSFLVVGIGASAGGLEALQEFVKILPKQTNCAFILAQHLSPTYKSMMVDLLSRQTNKKIVEIKHGSLIEPEILYITPPNNDVIVQNGKMYLKPPLSQIGPKPSIDIFFESLARDQKENAIGIILSGTGSDGSHGVRAIKAEGGITIAQEPESTKYDGMVISAINTGNIDFVLPVSKIVEEIDNISRYSYENKTIEYSNENRFDPFSEIFQIVQEKKSVDFKDYKISTIRRRLARRMAALKIIAISDYVSYLKTNAKEVDALYQDILIGVTYFFRDKDAFNELKQNLEIMIKHNKDKENIRVWIPGCSTGEEAYTIAIILHQILGIELLNYKVQIFATDIDDESLEIARKSKYPEASFQDVDSAILKKYFVRQGQHYNVIKPIRDMVIFSHHNINIDPPFLRVNLISCRNLLIYFNQKLQEKIFPVFHYSLHPNGILFLGKSESVGKFSTLFEVVNKKEKIYKSQITKSSPLLVYQLQNKTKPYEIPNHTNHITEYSIQEATKDTITNIFLPNSVVINTNHDIIYFQEELFSYLKVSPGNATFNIFKMIDDRLNLELRSILHIALKERASKKSRFIRFETKEELLFVQIIVTPLLNIIDKELYLVSFLEEKEYEVRSMGAIIDEDSENIRTKELEFELKSTKEHLQTVIEELETSNEEMQSLNEELQSSNEELQSSNEELETSNEELQSSNEELQTAYSELNHINKELENKSIEIEKTNNLLNTKKDKLLVTTKRFETALESTDGGIFEYFLDGSKKGFFSTKFANILGYQKNEIAKYEKDIFGFLQTIIVPNQLEIFMKGYSVFLKEQKKYDMALKIITKDNILKFVHIYIKIIPMEGSNKVVGLIIDVDQKYKDTVVLNLQKQKLDTIFDAVDNMILISDGEELLEVNGAFTRYFHLTLQQFKKHYKCICELFQNDEDSKDYIGYDIENPRNWVKQLLVSSNERKVKININGVIYHFKITLKQINLDANIIGYLISLNDITTQVTYEENLKQEVEKRIEQIRKQDELLLSQSKSAAMGEMISAIAHQWRQPLNTLSLYNIALESKELLLKDDIKEFREKSNNVIRQMSQTINDFRDFFKPNKNKEKFFIFESIEKVLGILYAQLKEKNIIIKNNVDHELDLFNFKSEFEQVLINLINNSKDAILKASVNKSKGMIEFNSHIDDGKIVLEILDNGGGIDTSIIDKIFEPYFTTKFESQGTGLGLYMSKMIIERNMGGQIVAVNNKSGTTFKIIFGTNNE